MKKKKILRFAILSGLIFNISVSCAKKDDDEKVSTTASYTAASTTCNSSTTTPTVSESDIISPPNGVQSQLVGHYTTTKYIKVADYNIHVNIDDMQIVEDIHMMLDHLMMRVLKDRLPK